LPLWFFATDLHGRRRRYEALLRLIREERPAAVLLGGDLLPHGYVPADTQLGGGHFVEDYILPNFERLRCELGETCPNVFLILGNDDPRSNEPSFQYGSETGAWNYVRGRKTTFGGFDIYGYSYVPPTPFHLKDSER
jgi:Icc-related predicted phosphoesterase